MGKRHRVTLTPAEQEGLARLISRGNADVRKLAHGRVLLPHAGRRAGPPGSTATSLE